MSGEIVQPVYASGECEIDLAQRELRVRGAPAPLGGRAFEIIEILAQSAGELVTKKELINRIWPGATVPDNAVQVHAAAIRKALGPYRALLKTEAGRGYRLVGEWGLRHHYSAGPPVGPAQALQQANVPETNFPPGASLVGRATAIQQLQYLLSAYRVVTLTGPGGIGKTTLALEVARSALDEFADGGKLVELASLTDPSLVSLTVGVALGLKLPGEEISAEAVARAVGPRKLLLLLDNCEHVIDAAATTAETLVRLCPCVTILATSRQTLRIAGERVYRVPPLDVPNRESRERDHIVSHSAVQLFIARAETLGSETVSLSENLPAVAAICRHLDGIPLAIEFAATRAVTMGLGLVVAKLGDRFELLTAGRRTALPRHRTLRATLDWSYDTLDEAERLLLRRLAIFAGGFTLEAAAAIMEDPDSPLSVADGISNLIDKSLVVHSSSVGRWRLLETIRAYALEKLAKSADAQSVARRHLEFYCGLLEKAASDLVSRSFAENMIRFTLEIDNLRAALDWAFSDGGDVRLGVRLASQAVDFWLSTSHLAECRDWCAKALAHLVIDAGGCDEMLLQCGLGISLIRTKGMTPEAKTALTRAAALSETLADFNYSSHRLLAIFGLWLFHLRAARLPECLALAGKYEAIARAIGAPGASETAHRMLGQSQYFLGEYASAAVSLQRARASYASAARSDDSVRLDADPLVVNLCYEAATLWSLGFVDKAIRARQDALKVARDINHPISLCLALASPSGVLAAKMGDPEDAQYCVNELIDYSARHSLVPYYTFGLCAKGSLMADGGDVMSADRFLREGIKGMREIGYHLYYAFFLAEWAMVLSSSGRLDEGVSQIDSAQHFAEESQSLWCLPEVLRIKGEILLKRGSTDLRTVEDCFERARILAHRRDGLSWELRATTSLARLLRGQQRLAEANSILRPVYDRFTEGFNTADLKKAKDLLDSLQ
jgi:non-specific serine/threonine protein kinase